MKKGVDHALFRRMVADNSTGDLVEDRLQWLRPPYGVKELARRQKAKKAAKKARAKQHMVAAIERRHRQRRSARA